MKVEVGRAPADRTAGARFRVLVTGSRTWEDGGTLSFQLGAVFGEAFHAGRRLGDVVVVHGDCPTGADRMADRVAANWRIAVEPHPAEWKRYGLAAGPLRNAEMVKLGADLCLAFIRGGSRGASGCADMAERAGIEVRRFLAP